MFGVSGVCNGLSVFGVTGMVDMDRSGFESVCVGTGSCAVLLLLGAVLFS